MIRTYRLLTAIIVLIGVSGCANMTVTEQRTLSGAAIGALGGAAIAAISAGNVATGTAIGAGVGAGAGYLYSRSRNENSAAHQAAYHPAKRQQVTRQAKPPTPAPAKRTDQLLASD